jgi:hypothetical protein
MATAHSTSRMAKGESNGATYDPPTKELLMKHDVKVDWQPASPNAKPLHIEAPSLRYLESAAEIDLLPTGRMTRDELTFEGEKPTIRLRDDGAGPQIHPARSTPTTPTEPMRRPRKQLKYAADKRLGLLQRRSSDRAHRGGGKRRHDFHRRHFGNGGERQSRGDVFQSARQGEPARPRDLQRQRRGGIETADGSRQDPSRFARAARREYRPENASRRPRNPDRFGAPFRHTGVSAQPAGFPPPHAKGRRHADRVRSAEPHRTLSTPPT